MHAWLIGASSDMSVIKNVTITPNPPQKGKPITIDAWFTLSKKGTRNKLDKNYCLFLFLTMHRGKYHWWFFHSKDKIRIFTHHFGYY